MNLGSFESLRPIRGWIRKHDILTFCLRATLARSVPWSFFGSTDLTFCISTMMELRIYGKNVFASVLLVAGRKGLRGQNGPPPQIRLKVSPNFVFRWEKEKKKRKSAVFTRCNLGNLLFFSDPIHINTRPFPTVFPSRKQFSLLLRNSSRPNFRFSTTLPANAFRKKSFQRNPYGIKMWNTISVGHGLLCSGPLSVTVYNVLNLCRSRSVMVLLPLDHGPLCLRPLSVTVCYALALCQ